MTPEEFEQYEANLERCVVEKEAIQEQRNAELLTGLDEIGVRICARSKRRISAIIVVMMACLVFCGYIHWLGNSITGAIHDGLSPTNQALTETATAMHTLDKSMDQLNKGLEPPKPHVDPSPHPLARAGTRP
jgi:hypothetical protein